MIQVRFTESDAIQAYNDWHANCGPGALAAMLGLTLEDVHPLIDGFDRKHYTNPRMMFGALKAAGATWRLAQTRLTDNDTINWPTYGLVRVQWEGPWTRPGVPRWRRYRYSHWIGCDSGASFDVPTMIFDINCMEVGGVVSLAEWAATVVPAILSSCHPKATGDWHLTHVIELKRPTSCDHDHREEQR